MVDKRLDYALRKKNILKWYEYVMTYPDQEIPEEIKEQIAEDIPEVKEQLEEVPVYASEQKKPSRFWESSDGGIDEEIASRYSTEEVDLSTTGLSEDDQALVADIMARFEQVKSAQANVDSLFSGSDEPISEEDLVSSICEPKQNNVDDLIKQAYETM